MHRSASLASRGPRAALTALVAVGLWTGFLASPGEGTQQPPAQNPGAEKFPAELGDSFLVTTGYRGACFGQSYTYTLGGRSLSRIKRERGAASDPWIPLEAVEGVSYFVTGVAARDGGDELYVAGICDDGACVIERWTYRPRPHGWRVTYPLPAEVDELGEPAPAATPVLAVTDGGAWAAPTTSELRLAPAVRKVLHKNMEGPFHGLDVDPQGRYLIFYDMGRNELHRLDLTQDPPVDATLSTLATQPHLDKAGNIQVLDFEGEGRKLLLRPVLSDAPVGPQVFTLLADANNDGVFESWTVMDKPAWNASPYSDWSKWTFFWKE